ncbi:MAG: hypothetical protein KGJ43_02405 [Acidobacteriota bacterium]|nr:hypothetical protein [Acidobacteriota bacterium]
MDHIDPRHMDDSAMSRSALLPDVDVCLLLRAHAEELWLSREVLPVVLQLEAPGTLPAEQLPAAAAYLEVMWMQAQLRAWETDAVFAGIHGPCDGERALIDPACHYHAAVQAMRETLAARVAGVISGALDAA